MFKIIIALFIYDCVKFIGSIILARIVRKKDPAEYDAILNERKKTEFNFDARVGQFTSKKVFNS